MTKRTPNAETISALKTSRAGKGEVFTGPTEAAFAKILAKPRKNPDHRAIRKKIIKRYSKTLAHLAK